MSKLSKEKQNQIAVVAVGSLAVAVGIYFVLIQGQLDSIALTQRKTTDIRNKLDQASGYVRQALTVSNRLAETRSLLTEKEATLVPDSGDPYDWMIRNITSFAQSHRGVFSVTMVRPKIGDVEMIPGFPYKAATFHVSATGFFHEFGRFLADFENKYRYYQIINLEIAPCGPVVPGGALTPLTGADGELLQFQFDIVAPINPVSEASKK
jgi:Tfp pilus assembly protein PilO